MGLVDRSRLWKRAGVFATIVCACLGPAPAKADSPDIQVARRVTGAARPLLAGTIEGTAGLQRIEVRIAGVEGVLSARLFPEGDWIALLPEPLKNGVYTLQVAAYFEDGRTVERVFEDALNIDLVGPVVSIEPLYTNSPAPILVGKAIDQAGLRSVEISISGIPCPSAVQGSSWEAAVEEPLTEGTHLASVTAVDSVGNETTKSFPAAIVMDETPPVVVVMEAVTEDTTPALSGRVEDAASGIERVVVSINGTEYTAEVSPEGDWLVADDVIEKPLKLGVYDVEAVATDRAGNTAADVTEDELRVIGEQSPSGSAAEEE